MFRHPSVARRGKGRRDMPALNVPAYSRGSRGQASSVWSSWQELLERLLRTEHLDYDPERVRFLEVRLLRLIGGSAVSAADISRALGCYGHDPDGNPTGVVVNLRRMPHTNPHDPVGVMLALERFVLPRPTNSSFPRTVQGLTTRAAWLIQLWHRRHPA
jgi:hypothetical protein